MKLASTHPSSLSVLSTINRQLSGLSVILLPAKTLRQSVPTVTKNNHKAGDDCMSTSKFRNLFLGLVSLFIFPMGSVRADYEVNMTEGVTALSREIYDIHMLIFWICVVIAAIVFGIMFWSMFHHRKSRGAKAANFHHNTAAEIVWTVIPILILIGMAFPATQALVHIESTGDADMTIKVTGYQWKWQYDYVDEGFSFFSVLAHDLNAVQELNSDVDPASIDHYLLDVDQPLVLPVNKKIRVLTTSNDVIHSWWVPEIGWKRDSIPGFINESWTLLTEEGTFRGQCAELCGKDHGYMPIVVKAVSEEEYMQWVAQMKEEQVAAEGESDKTFSKDELLAKGEQVYAMTCVACHQITGLGIPPAFPPLVGSAITTGPLAEHLNIVLNGKAGTAMQAFGSQLSAADIAAVITYERNTWGNAEQLAGEADMVQPAEVKAAMNPAPN
jgi:cytochrome c oxidase subunit 2